MAQLEHINNGGPTCPRCEGCLACACDPERCEVLCACGSARGIDCRGDCGECDCLPEELEDANESHV